MSPLLLILYALVLVILGVAVLVMINGLRSKGAIARSLDMVLLSFELPRFGAQNAGGQQKPDRELIALMEQLYASVATLHVSGWNKFLHGDPYIALEMAVPHVGEQIHFFV